MKGISGNPVLDAYQRVSVSAVGGAREVAKVGNDPSPNQQPGTGAAKINISAEARELAASSVENQVNVEKVEALRNTVQAGKLELDPHLIASRMLDVLG
jgi:flagellar biosynthesis anti-sigma factor FlgM